jgi:iron complex outermembrane receptor protein
MDRRCAIRFDVTAKRIFTPMRSFLLLGAASFALMAQPALADTEAGANEADTPPAPAPIIVTATPFRHTADETPAISARVDAQQIRAAGGASVADALRDIPGVAATGFAAGASRPIIRGMDSNRVRMLEDGTSASDVSDIGPDHGIPIDPLAARSIEVVRGAATLRYGSQAIGGVVNTINNRVPTSLSKDPVSAEANLAYGSVANALETSALADVKLGNVALHADGFRRHQGDYDTPEGTQTNSFFRGKGGALGGSYFLPDGDSHVGLAVVHYDAKYGIPAGDTYIDMAQTKLMSRNSIALGKGLLKTLTLDGSYADYQHSERDSQGVAVATFKNREVNLRGEMLLNAIGAIRNTALGVEYQHRNFSALGEASDYLSPATSQNLAAYVFSEMELTPKLHLEGSARVEQVRVTGTPLSGDFTRRSYTPASGALGLLYTLADGVKLGTTISTTGRAPALTELFARGGHDGPMTYETGSADLKVERAKAIEASLRVHRGPFRFEGSLYSTWFNNYIYGALSGRTCDDAGTCTSDPDGELRELFYTQGGAHFRGAEAEASYDVLRVDAGTLRVKLMGDLTRATLDGGGNVPRIPPYRFGGGLNWAGKQAQAGFTLTHYGRQNDFGAYDTATPSYNALNAQVSWQPLRSMPGLELSVIGQNLTNDVQHMATAFNKDTVVMPGRSVRLTLRMATF